jgi:hypothetical protein
MEACAATITSTDAMVYDPMAEFYRHKPGYLDDAVHSLLYLNSLIVHRLIPPTHCDPLLWSYFNPVLRTFPICLWLTVVWDDLPWPLDVFKVECTVRTAKLIRPKQAPTDRAAKLQLSLTGALGWRRQRAGRILYAGGDSYICEPRSRRIRVLEQHGCSRSDIPTVSAECRVARQSAISIKKVAQPPALGMGPCNPLWVAWPWSLRAVCVIPAEW